MKKALFGVALFSSLFFSLSASAASGVLNRGQKLFLFPESSSQVVGDIAFGTKLEMLQESGSWGFVEIKVGSNKLKGWIPLDSVTLENGVPANAKKAAVERDEPSVDADEAYKMSSDAYTSFYFPTALPRAKGTGVARGHYFLGWQFEYSPLDMTTVGLHMTVPIGIFGIGPQFKQSIKLHEKFHLGIGGTGGALFSLWERRNSKSAYYYATGIMSTVGDANYGLTLGGYIMGAKIDTYDHVFVGDINAHARITDRVKFMLDFFTPMYSSNGGSIEAFDWSVITYGLRIGGQSLSADVGFSIPIYDGASDFLKYVPLGIPYIAMTVFI